MRVLTCFALLLVVSHSTAKAERPDSEQVRSPLLSTPQVSFTRGELTLSHGTLIAHASEAHTGAHTEAEVTEVSYRYKLLIGDLAAVGFVLAAPFSDGVTAPFGVASYFLTSPLVHFFEPDNQEGGSKALWSVWYRLGIPVVGSGLGLVALSLMSSDEVPGLLFAYSLGLGTLLGGMYGLYKDYKSAVKVKTSGATSATAARYLDPASREVLMWQSIMAQSARSNHVEAQ